MSVELLSRPAREGACAAGEAAAAHEASTKHRKRTKEGLREAVGAFLLG